jgi:hypothetical protein
VPSASATSSDDRLMDEMRRAVEKATPSAAGGHSL